MTGSQHAAAFPWTDEQIAILRDGLAAGRSHANIAGSLTAQSGLPLTRNACIGKAHRLGFHRGPEYAAATAKASAARQFSRAAYAKGVKERRAERDRLKLEKSRPAGWTPGVRKPPVAPVDRCAAILSPDARVWTERRLGQCSFPVSGSGADLISCCAPVIQSGLCAGHYAVCYRPAPQRKPTTTPSLRRRAA